ncbi:MAG: UDP-N-acetylglucosamine 2-epimerase (non-hydrolyzing) [Tissierellia bacterium]|nr:UDP-N-acetylglucosamine 2-epimerase (non-hydrolyzing) [Tissierellia bacterium]
MKKILSIIGARPQFVKEAVVQSEINKYDDLNEIVVHTGQHYDENMSGSFFEILKMKKPEYNLAISGGSHGEMTGRMLIELDKIFLNEEPDIVVLYGDTNSTLAGAISAAKFGIPVAHIEAGLRQEPKDMPEEINRVLTDRISKYLFVPSDKGIENLKREGITEGVYFTGDVMYDIFLKMENLFEIDFYKELELEKDNYIVMTMHRDFNVDHQEKLTKLLSSIQKISSEMPIVFPIHPRTEARIREFGLDYYLKGIKVIKPIDYLKLMGLTQNAYAIITDSGGYQKESYFSGKNALVMMPDTSWIELVDEGINTLVNEDNLYEEFLKISTSNFKEGIYGIGDAAKKIVKIISEK